MSPWHCRQLLRTDTHLQSQEVRARCLQPPLPPCPNHAPGSGHDSWFPVGRKDHFTPEAEAKHSPQPHLFSAPLESSGMDSPAGKLGHPWSWACLLSGEHRWVTLNYLLCSARGGVGGV